MNTEDNGMCIRCGKRPVYVAPNGRVGKICAICLYNALAKLGVIPPVKVTVTVDPPASPMPLARLDGEE